MTTSVAQIPRAESTAVAVYEPARTSFSLDGNAIEQCAKIANLMAKAKVTVPNHLAGKEGDCFAIALQAMQWGMNPFVVAQKTHVVNGTLGYEAQLVNAVASASGMLASAPDYKWEGVWASISKDDKDDSRACTVFATLRGESSPRSLRVSMAQVGTVRNSPLWTSDPRQQLAYLALKRFIRLHAPGALLGVYTVDELQDDEQPRPVSAEIVVAQVPMDSVESARADMAAEFKRLGWDEKSRSEWWADNAPAGAGRDIEKLRALTAKLKAIVPQEEAEAAPVEFAAERQASGQPDEHPDSAAMRAQAEEVPF